MIRESYGLLVNRLIIASSQKKTYLQYSNIITCTNNIKTTADDFFLKIHIE